MLHETATRDAVAVDSAKQPNPSGLHGVPIGVKELFDVAGGDNSYGSELRSGITAVQDAVIVRRLRSAGAIVVGLTRSHEYGWGITTQHSSRGSTRNPWNLDRVPGGSSGGSAAAVAAGFVPIAVGSDTGGSIRIPAAFCGVLGLKTTPGRIPRSGGVALAPTFDTPGLIARSVGLLRDGFAAIAGPDISDLSSFDVAANVGELALSELRFSVPPELQPFELSPSHAGALAVVVSALEELGARQVETRVPSASRMFDLFVPHQMGEALYVHSRLLKTWPSRRDAYGEDVRTRLEAAELVSRADFVASVLEARAARGEYLAAFRDVDLLVSVVGSTGPSSVGDPDSVCIGDRPMALRDANFAHNSAPERCRFAIANYSNWLR